MACSTLSLVTPLTGTTPFITFETVLGETPARRATSLTVRRTASLSKMDVNDVTARYPAWLTSAASPAFRGASAVHQNPNGDADDDCRHPAGHGRQGVPCPGGWLCAGGWFRGRFRNRGCGRHSRRRRPGRKRRCRQCFRGVPDDRPAARRRSRADHDDGAVGGHRQVTGAAVGGDGASHFFGLGTDDGELLLSPSLSRTPSRPVRTATSCGPPST